MPGMEPLAFLSSKNERALATTPCQRFIANMFVHHQNKIILLKILFVCYNQDIHKGRVFMGFYSELCFALSFPHYNKTDVPFSPTLKLGVKQLHLEGNFPFHART